MNKKNSTNEFAKECMVASLIQLAEEKPFSSITISELTAKAGVSRMTYYRNYSSKEAILQQYMKKILTDFQKEMAASGRADHFGDYEHIVYSFSHLKKNDAFVQCLLKVGMSYIFLDALNEYMKEFFYDEETDTKEKAYILQAYAGSLFNVYMTWIADGQTDDIEQISKTLQKIYHITFE